MEALPDNETPESKPLRKCRCRLVLAVAAILVTGLLLPESPVIPVEGATPADWNHTTFWYEPWGASGVHKGIDVFAAQGTPVITATAGIVVFAGSLERGGNVIAVLGPKWRIHYYAHLDAVGVTAGSLVTRGAVIGSVGNTGNAASRPAHLHYSVLSLLPRPWQFDTATQGWKKMFFIDPRRLLMRTEAERG